MKNKFAVIIAGGIGSRFWPISNEKLPKQFLDILGTGESLLQQTFRRLSKICPRDNILIVTNQDYKNLCEEQISQIKEKNILSEPSRRNTAPCIAYAAFKIRSRNPKASMIVAPCDHFIPNEKAFKKIINHCLSKSIKQDILITIGIKATRPETGYGYIQFSDKKLDDSNIIKKVKTFSEKPSQDLALQFIDSGDFLWNSGIFIWSVDSIIKAFRKHLFDIYTIFEDGKEYYNTIEEKNFINRFFPSCKNISVDYGIMEKSENVYVYPAELTWSDLGTWSSLYSHLKLDKNKNAVEGERVLLYNSSNNIVKMPKDKVTVLHGLDNYIIIERDNILLICKKEDEQNIKQFVEDVKKQLKN